VYPIHNKMATVKRIIKISKEEHDRLKRDYGHTFDLYFQGDQHYVIGDLKDLKAAGVPLNVPFY